MIKTFKLTQADLTAIILCLRSANTDNLVHRVIYILLDQYFNETNIELIWLYATRSEKNKFSSIEELYEYLKDPYSNIVTTDSALTLSQLRELFPNEDMFKAFDIITNRSC